ncbi:MAG: sugar lyase, partial [Alistipes sp.]|nr:sugar lyase [Alistipes sp.]
YEYLMVVHASDEEVAAYSNRLPYEVLRCDASAHILRDRSTGTEAYALFEAGRIADGRLAAASHPSLVMLSGDDELVVSLCDPDLRFYDGPADERYDAAGRRIERSIYSRSWIDDPSQPSEICLTLRGRWTPEPGSECRTEAEGDDTRLYLVCREGATREVKLKKQTGL